MISAILDHLWQSTLLALGLGVLALAFGKARASLRYGLWFAASAKFLVPFAALAALGRLLAPAIRPPPEATPGAQFIARATQPFSQAFASSPATHATAPLAHAAIAASSASPAAHAAIVLDPAVILFALWALGCATVLIFWMACWAKVRSAVRQATPLALPAPMTILASPWMREPALVGLWRPVLMVPETLFDHLASPEIDAIVAHESCHLSRRDNLTAAIHMLVQALFWFHPMVWWIGARLIDERERACDEAVVQSGHDRTAYARSLVETCRLYLQSPLACVAGASGSDLKKRVVQIMTAQPSSPLSRPKKALLLTAGLCAIASPVAAGWLTSPAGREATARVVAIASTVVTVRSGDARPAPLASDRAASPAVALAQGAAPPALALASLSTSPPAIAAVASVDVSKLSLIPVSARTPDAGAVLAPAEAPPGPVPTLLTSKPVWVRLPRVSGSSSNTVYPTGAERLHQPGRAAMRCRVDDRGDLTGCVVTSESPAGMGFGEKAIFLSLDYKLRTLAEDGAPVRDHLVDVTVHFTPQFWARIVGDSGKYDYSRPPQVVRWVVYPSARRPVYPVQARPVGAAAEVALHCRVKADGFLTACAVAKEEPKGLGFGRAALLAHVDLIRVEQRALDGTPTEGRMVEIRYVMNPPCDAMADRNQTPCPAAPLN